MSRSCHSATFFERRDHRRAHQAGEAGQVLRQHRVALVRHGGGALLARREIFLGLAHFGALEMADLDGDALHGRGDHGERREERGVAVARDHLGRDRLDCESELLRDVFLDARVDVGEGADRARDGAGRDLAPRRDQPLAVARELGVEAGELEAEGHGLGVDAVAAPDAGRHLVLERAALEHGEQGVDIGEQDVGGLGELDGEAGVEHVGRRHALVDEARLRPDVLGEAGQEGDDVVLGLALDLVDAGDVEGALLAHDPGGLLRDHAELGLGLAGERLDLEPDAELVLGLPDGGHLGTGIAGDHAGPCVIACCLLGAAFMGGRERRAVYSMPGFWNRGNSGAARTPWTTGPFPR